MTKAELFEILVQLKNADPECGHQNADMALLDFIDDDDVTDAFLELDRWYA